MWMIDALGILKEYLFQIVFDVFFCATYCYKGLEGLGVSGCVTQTWTRYWYLHPLHFVGIYVAICALVKSTTFLDMLQVVQWAVFGYNL